jgi:ATP adenylyltransferase/5',5'''-P-1,P-4-tetraphosphate phosphorylase II
MLTPELHDWAWDVCARTPISGLNLAYNSTGAGASVNHLHFQSFVQPAQLPVQNPLFAHNGGNLAYPLPCLRFDNPQQAWARLDQLHQHNQPYNLLYSKHALHLVPRVPQGDKRLSARSNGYGWSEMAGAINLFGREEFESMDTTEIETELASFAA